MFPLMKCSKPDCEAVQMQAQNFFFPLVGTIVYIDINYSKSRDAAALTVHSSRAVLISASHLLDQARSQAFFDQYAVVWVLPQMTNVLAELFSVKGLFVYSLLNTDPTTSTLCHSPKQQEGECCQHFSCDLCTPVQIAAHSLFLALQHCSGNCTAIGMAPSHTDQTQLLFPHALLPTSLHLVVIFLGRTPLAFACC